MNDYYTNYTNFINHAKSLKTNKDKIKFITDYIKYYCEYDYAFLTLALIKGNGFYNVMENYRRIDIKNTYMEDYPDYSQITHALSLGKITATSDLFYEIIKDINTNDFSKAGYIKNINEIRIKLSDFLAYYLYDSDLIERYANDIINVLESELKKTFYNDRMTKYVKTIDYIIFDMCNSLHYLFERKYYNGMITKGVCEGFSDFIVRACEDLDIPCVKVCSDNHAWNLVKIRGDFIMIDSTSSLVGFDIDSSYYKDKILTKKEIEEDNSINADYNYMTLDEFFNAFPNREINEIGDWKIDNSINKDNYKEKESMNNLVYSFEDDILERKKEIIYRLKTNKC